MAMAWHINVSIYICLLCIVNIYSSNFLVYSSIGLYILTVCRDIILSARRWKRMGVLKTEITQILQYSRATIAFRDLLRDIRTKSSSYPLTFPIYCLSLRIFQTTCCSISTDSRPVKRLLHLKVRQLRRKYILEMLFRYGPLLTDWFSLFHYRVVSRNKHKPLHLLRRIEETISERQIVLLHIIILPIRVKYYLHLPEAPVLKWEGRMYSPRGRTSHTLSFYRTIIENLNN